ncbi:MAG: hypothetical protein FWB96_11070 [Defluviitaleaceae bacterium]|nr:hypothetical protein [Defluviitaleaceae bacterium]MCL2263520.1 hypothetical protein [Defluviitaleaceae bacterium]
MNSTLTFSDKRVSISGEYYTVSNGFIAEARGEIQISYKDLLAVEFVKRRSKKVMYAMLFPAATLMFAWNLKEIVPFAAMAVLAMVVCFMAVVYLSSVRQFVEITSMKGTYRIPVPHGDSEMEVTVSQLQKRISS